MSEETPPVTTEVKKASGFRRLTSRKFLLPVVTGILLAVSDTIGIKIDEDRAIQIIVLVLGWVGIEGGVDFARAWKNGK